jgi:hypothetical protein
MERLEHIAGTTMETDTLTTTQLIVHRMTDDRVSKAIQPGPPGHSPDQTHPQRLVDLIEPLVIWTGEQRTQHPQLEAPRKGRRDPE